MKNQTINYLKAIACMCVVFVHAKFPGDFGTFVNAVSRAAVAYFFVVSGWYSYYKDRSVSENRCIKRLKRICIILAVSIGFYLLWGVLLEAVRDGAAGSARWLRQMLSLENGIRFVLLNEVSIAEPLWFLPAMACCYLLWILVNRLRLERVAGCAAVGLLLLALAGQIAPVIPVKQIVRTAWLYGFPVFMLANRMHKVWDEGKVCSNKKLVWAIPASCGLIYIEWRLFGNLQFYAGSIILAFLMFLMAVSNPALLSNRIICVIGERYSLYVYILHWAMMSVVLKAAAMLRIEGLPAFSWMYPILVAAFTLAAAVAVEYMVKNLAMLRFVSKR